MGFSIYAQSTEEVAPERAEAIGREALALAEGRTWLSCEPPFVSREDDGRLFCSFKPNFSPDPGDVEAAEASDEPDGTMTDAIDVLARLSRDHDVDWEIRHDEAPGPVGHIRAGVVDDAIPDMIAALDAMAEAIAEFDPEADG